MTTVDVLINGSIVGSAVALVLLIIPVVILLADTARALRRLLDLVVARRQASRAVADSVPAGDDEIEQMIREWQKEDGRG